MAITVHPAVQRRPKAMEQLGMGFSRAAQMGSEYLFGEHQQRLQKQEQQAEREKRRNAASEYLGMSLPEGISDEDLGEILKSELARKRGLELEGLKQQGKGKSNALDVEEARRQKALDVEEARRKRGLELEELRQKRPTKEPKKTQASQPIDSEQLDKIQEVRNKPGFSEASPSKKYQMFTDNGVSKENAKAESDIYAEEEKIKTEKGKTKAKKTEAQKKQEFNEKLRVHKESEDYDKEILSKSRTAKRTLENVKEARNSMKSGKVKPTSAVNILSFFGDVGKTLANAIQSGDHAAVRALMPEFLEGKKELFGIRLSDADLRLLQDKSIDISKSPEANEAILKLIQKYADQSILRGDIASEIVKKNKNYRPLGYERMVDEEFDRQMSPVKMVDDKGFEYETPAYRVGVMIKKGYRIKNEQ